MQDVDQPTAEVGLIASMLLEPSVIAHVETVVSESDFASPERRDLFGLLLNMHHAGESIRDLSLVFSRIRDASLLERLGGPKGFRVFTNHNAVANVEVYATAVRSHSVKRTTIKLSEQFARRVQSEDPTKLTKWLRCELDAIESMASSFRHVSTIGESCSQLISEIEATKAEGTSPGVATGIDHIDQLYGGLHQRRMYIAAGRPGGGKTSLSQQIGEHIASQNQSAFFVSLEMSRTEIAGRYLARQTGINSKYINAHIVDESDIAKMRAAEAESKSLPFIVSEPSSRQSTLSAICAEIRLQKTIADISIAIIDYLQIIEPARAGQIEYERFSEATRAFKQLARELKIPILLLSQLNRGSEKDKPREPRASDLRGSGTIEQDADGIFLLHDEGRGKIKLIIPKMRGGERSETTLRFDGPTCTFSAERIEDHPNYHPEFDNAF